MIFIFVKWKAKLQQLLHRIKQAFPLLFPYASEFWTSEETTSLFKLCWSSSTRRWNQRGKQRAEQAKQGGLIGPYGPLGPWPRTTTAWSFACVHWSTARAMLSSHGLRPDKQGLGGCCQALLYEHGCGTPHASAIDIKQERRQWW